MVAAAVVLRGVVLASSLGRVDADEAVVGLMARHILHGQFPAFYWGQSQGGSIEAFLVAASFLVFGKNGFALQIVPISLFFGSALLVWRIGMRVVGLRASRIAAAVFLLGSTASVRWSAKARGHYSPLLVLELVVLLLGLRVTQGTDVTRSDHRRHAEIALLGFFIGLGWWESPQIAYVALPVLITVGWRLRSHLRELLLVPAAGLVGATPWIAFNVANRWDSLSLVGTHGLRQVPSRLAGFFRLGLPESVGFRMPISHEWLPPVAGEILYAALICAVLIFSWKKKAPLILWIAVIYPMIFALLPFAGLYDSRYVFFLWPFMAIIIGTVLAQLSQRMLGTATAAILVIAFLSTAGIIRMIEEPKTWKQWDISTPTDIKPLIYSLERRSILHAYAPYAIAYPITFSSGERIIATPVHDVRYQPYMDAVRRSKDPAYILLDASSEVAFKQAIIPLGISPGCDPMDGFVVCRPNAPVPLPLIKAILT